MALVSSIVIWSGESFDAIRPAVESCICLDEAIAQSGFPVTRYTSVFTSVFQNTEDPRVQQWAEKFTRKCDARGLELFAVRFDPKEPMQTLSSGKHHLLSSSLRYLGDRVILHDIPLDKAMAKWAVQEFLSIDWPTDDCLVVVRTPPDNAIHLAFCTSREAYLEMGLLMFAAADYRAVGCSTVTSLDDLCRVMTSAARRNGWGVKSLRWPPSSLGFWKRHAFGTFLFASALWFFYVLSGETVSFVSLAILFCVPPLNVACVISMWRHRMSLWRSLLATLLLLPQAFLWIAVIWELLRSILGAR